MDYKKLATDILALVGGAQNVSSVTNCMTRLRFQLHDSGKADVDGLKALNGVQGVVTKNGQFQVVIGTDVENVCVELKKIGRLDEESTGPREKQGILNTFFGALTAIF